MFRLPLPKRRIDEIEGVVKRLAGEGDLDAAWKEAQPLLRRISDPAIAQVVVALVRKGAVPQGQRLEALRQVFASHSNDIALLSQVAIAYESAHEIRFLNAAPPDDPFVSELARRLQSVATTTDELQCWQGLSVVGRCLGRAWDDVTESAKKRCCQLNPGSWAAAYDLGLFYKVRGRFAEGMAANQKAVELGGGEDESVRWNLAICATGARAWQTALEIQQSMGLKLKLGRFGLPEGGFGMVKVRLAERPLAERDASADDPGQEETIWIERLSACHGIVRSVLMGKLGVDYGDVVLFDGAPITTHMVNGEQVPVFPHLATLERRGYRFHDFVGQQNVSGELARLTADLPGDAVLYSHTENVRVLCRACADGEGSHAHDLGEGHEQLVVRGRIASPPSLSESELLAALDAALENAEGVRLYVPTLCVAAGNPERAEVERRRTQMLETNG